MNGELQRKSRAPSFDFHFAWQNSSFILLKKTAEPPFKHFIRNVAVEHLKGRCKEDEMPKIREKELVRAPHTENADHRWPIFSTVFFLSSSLPTPQHYLLADEAARSVAGRRTRRAEAANMVDGLWLRERLFCASSSPVEGFST